MAFNIAITSKYKPFTYEEIVKPLEGYWKDYDKQEEDLTKLKTDAYAIKSYLDTLPKVEGPDTTSAYTDADQKLINQYNNYIKAIEDISSQMASSGLNYDLKTRAKALPSIYNEQIAPISTAIDRRIKFIDTLRAQEAKGNWVDLDINKLNLASFIDGPLPEYHVADTSYLGNLITTAASSATKNMSLKKTGSKYIIGIKPENYRNDNLTREQRSITDKLEKDAFQEILKSLNMTEEDYTANTPQYRQEQITDFIKNRIAIGLSYNESPITKNTTSKPGPGSTGGFNTVVFPRKTSQETIKAKSGKSTIVDIVEDDYTAYDNLYNSTAQKLFKELKKEGKYTDENRYKLVTAKSQNHQGASTHTDKINLYQYNNTQQLYTNGVWQMPIYIYDTTKQKNIEIGSLPLEKRARDYVSGPTTKVRKQLNRSAATALSQWMKDNSEATDKEIEQETDRLASLSVW